MVLFALTSPTSDFHGHVHTTTPGSGTGYAADCNASAPRATIANAASRNNSLQKYQEGNTFLWDLYLKETPSITEHPIKIAFFSVSLKIAPIFVCYYYFSGFTDCILYGNLMEVEKHPLKPFSH